MVPGSGHTTAQRMGSSMLAQYGHAARGCGGAYLSSFSRILQMSARFTYSLPFIFFPSLTSLCSYLSSFISQAPCLVFLRPLLGVLALLLPSSLLPSPYPAPFPPCSPLLSILLRTSPLPFKATLRAHLSIRLGIDISSSTHAHRSPPPSSSKRHSTSSDRHFPAPPRAGPRPAAPFAFSGPRPPQPSSSLPPLQRSELPWRNGGSYAADGDGDGDSAAAEMLVAARERRRRMERT